VLLCRQRNQFGRCTISDPHKEKPRTTE
jgi:hypothetical protein